MSIERFAARSEEYLAELSTALREGSYRPQPVRRVEIAKGDGGTRPLGIPAVKDRIVQTAVKLVIEPIFEAMFRPQSYGFRPGRGCHDALREVDGLLEDGLTFVVDADLKGYFDSIPHERLLERVAERISDGRVLDLLRGWLEAGRPAGSGAMDADGGHAARRGDQPAAGEHLPAPAGRADGSSTAFGWCATRTTSWCCARAARRRTPPWRSIRQWVAENGLTLHPEKTHVGDCRKPEEGFDFLGYRFEAGRRWVRKKSLARLKDRIRAKTRRTRGDSLARIVADLNPMLRGWFGYFKHAHPYTFPAVDGFVRRRLRALLRKQEKRPGFGRCLADQRRWTNAFFAEAGLFALHPAWLAARHSR